MDSSSADVLLIYPCPPLTAQPPPGDPPCWSSAAASPASTACGGWRSTCRPRGASCCWAPRPATPPPLPCCPTAPGLHNRLRRAKVLLGHVVGVDLQGHTATLRRLDGSGYELAWDRLVLA